MKITTAFIRLTVTVCLAACLGCAGASKRKCNVTGAREPIYCEDGATWYDILQAYSRKGNVDAVVANNMNLSSVNSGICKFNETLRVLDLRGNAIKALPSLSCLRNLVKLLLNQNQLEYFNFKVVQGLTKLMELDLGSNRINYIDQRSGTDKEKEESLAVLRSLDGLNSLNMSDNLLTEADVFGFAISNIQKINLTHNKISKITNTLKIDFANESFTSGEFSVDLNYNEIKTLSLKDMEDFGFDILGSEMVRVWLTYCFELHENPWSCDCTMAKTLDLLRSVNTVAAFKANSCLNKLTQAKCKEPAKLKGKGMFTLSKEDLFDECIIDCGLTEEDDAYGKCVCTKNIENATHVDVDCFNKSFTSMPDFKLDYATLNVTLSHANIETGTLEWRSFMNSTKHLTLSHSSVSKVDDNFWSNLSESAMISLNLSDTAIKTLSQEPLEMHKFPLDSMDLGGKYSCHCDFVRWFEQWINGNETSSKLLNKQNIICEDGTRIDTWSSNPIVWTCEIPIIASLTTLFLLLATAVLTSYLFREELHVLMYRYVGLCCHPRANKYKVNHREHDAQPKVPEQKYDVYIFCADNDIRWAKDNVLDYLEGRAMDACPYNYTVGFQERDFLPGIPDADNMTNAVQRSQRFLFVLSQNMLRSIDCRKIFELANHVALKEGKNYMIIVQREKLSREQEAREPVLSAYLSRKYCLNPADRLFHEKLCFRLPPKLKEQRDDREIEIIM